MLTKLSVPVYLVGPQVSPTIWWVPASRGVFIFLGVIRRHFLACEDIAGGSPLSGGGIIIFHVIRRNFLAAAVDPAVSLSMTVLFRWKLVVDHINHAAPRAPWRWTTARPRKGTTRSWATGGRSRWYYSRPREAGADGTTSAALGGWSKKTRG